MGMLLTPLLVLLLAQATVPAEIRSVDASVTDEKGAPVAGLVSNDVAVLENGVARNVTLIEPDRRPLTVAFLVDTSQVVGSSLRLQLVEPIVSFLRRLPEGSRYSLWTTGDRPTKLVDFTADPAEADKALRRVAPQGGNTLFDALVEASQDLKKQEGQRRAVVAVTGLGIEFSSRDRQGTTKDAEGNADVFMAVEFAEGDASFEQRADYAYILETLTKRTGGLHETTLTPMGVSSALRKIGADLGSQYRLSYATLPDLKERKIEIKVARAGVKIRVGQPR